MAFHRSVIYYGRRPSAGWSGIVFSVVAGDTAAHVATILAVVFFVLLWSLVPLTGGRRRPLE